MQSYICLILDQFCQVMTAVILRGVLSEVTDAVKRLNKEKEGWGYEIWGDNRRIVSSYDCETPPGRAHIHRD